jgi:hypothetical protein
MVKGLPACARFDETLAKTQFKRNANAPKPRSKFLTDPWRQKAKGAPVAGAPSKYLAM